jgi:hypothetical protein
MLSFENRLITYYEWLFPSKFDWMRPDTWGFVIGALVIIFLLAVLSPFFWFVIASFSRGPNEAFYLVSRSLLSSFREDAPGFSFRRTWAVARLSLQEAIRNRVLIAFGLFLLVLLFAGLFLDVKNNNPARLYLSFVISTTNYLLLLMTVFLSTFSIPNDIKNKTIYTVVTKPVRAGELVLGRIIGFMGIGSLMLVAMGFFSYLFVLRGLSHSHEFVADSFQVIEEDTKKNTRVEQGETTKNQHHLHQITIDKEGNATANRVMGHTHEVTIAGTGKDRQVSLGPPVDMLIAKAPHYGKLVILDRNGAPSAGINVGDEWVYRGYIEGGYSTRSSAIWTFSNVTKERYPHGLPLELNLQVFRTYKGNIERGVLGEIVVRNPDPKARVKQSGPIVFPSVEFQSDFKLLGSEKNPLFPPGQSVGNEKLDWFDLVSPDGQVEIVLKCAEPAQYFGVAQADVYLRPPDGLFEFNFFKAYCSIWMQMLLVTCFGVMFSTFLSGPIALLATVSGVVMGLFGEFVRNVATGVEQGGGPVESIIRLVTQQNQTTDLEINSVAMIVIKGFDSALMFFMYGLTYLLPDLTQFDSSQFVANGLDIYADIMFRQMTLAAVYAVCAMLAGYFFLKSREIAG